jgi:hypothetical protein
MVAGRWLAIGVAAGVIAPSLRARDAAAHPLHTTLAQLTYDARTGALEASIRVFAGDFAAAAAKRRGAAPPVDDRLSDPAAFAYVTATFLVSDASGHAVPLMWCGSRRAGDVVWLCVRAEHAPAAAALRLSDQVLFELFDDQINIVQTAAGEEHASVLFTKGDGAKRAL